VGVWCAGGGGGGEGDGGLEVTFEPGVEAGIVGVFEGAALRGKTVCHIPGMV